MLLNRKSNINSNKCETTDIDKYLSQEHNLIGGGKKPWNKLEKITKIQKLNEFANTITDDVTILKDIKQYLKISLERKKLQRMKDVIYDSVKGKIKKIPGFTFNKKTGKFTLRRIDKKSSISKSLAPKTKKRRSGKKNATSKKKSNRKKSPLKKSPTNKKINKTKKKKKKKKEDL